MRFPTLTRCVKHSESSELRSKDVGVQNKVELNEIFDLSIVREVEVEIEEDEMGTVAVDDGSNRSSRSKSSNRPVRPLWKFSVFI